MEKALKKHAPIFVLPTFLAFVIGFIIPFAQGFYLSFCKFTTVGNATFVGISNYTAAIKDTSFTSSIYSIICDCIDLTDQRTGIWPGTASDTEVKGNQYFQNYFLYAEPDRWNRTWIYLADPDQLSAYDHRTAASGTEFFSRLLGTYHFDVLAADRIYDDYLHRRSSECTG